MRTKTGKRGTTSSPEARGSDDFSVLFRQGEVSDRVPELLAAGFCSAGVFIGVMPVNTDGLSTFVRDKFKG
jgi:hypothetical protein